MTIDVWVAEAHPHYVVMVDGQIYDEMTSDRGHPPLTWSQMTDVARGYEEGLVR